MISPRSYQVEAVSAIYTYFGNNTGNPVVAMPTGTGKSVVIAMFLESVFKYYPNQRVMILTHVKELIQQNYEKLMGLWAFAPAGVYSAGLNRRDVHAPITFAGIGSVAKKWAMFGSVDLVIIDRVSCQAVRINVVRRVALISCARMIPPPVGRVPIGAVLHFRF